MYRVISKEREKRLTADLIVICIISFAVLGSLMAFMDRFYAFAGNSEINIALRVAVAGFCGQFGVSGLGITAVCLYRKEKFSSFGLNTKNMVPALILSLACCIPDFIYCLAKGTVHAWCPFIDVSTTRAALTASFPYNFLAMTITAVCWGFFEGFNYVVIRDKLSELFPSKYRFLDWGALICAVFCILIHGAVGVTPDAVMEMLVTVFLIYGMLIVRKETGNAWGCVLIFFVYWNAL